jgi:phospholipid/cholesterol/gamma-HCH transport system substrate-binding protein
MARGKSIRERNPVLIGVLGIVVLAVIGLLTYYSDDLPIIGGGTTYTADFTEAAGLASGNEVRVAGVKVGTVSKVSLDGAKVKVAFKVKDTWVGNASTVSIKIKTLLGEKYLAVDPLGAKDQDPGQTIPESRTVSPYDVTEAFNGLADTVGQINTGQLAQSFQDIANTFDNTGPDVRSTLQGLSALSETISSRDNELSQLLANTKQITGDLANEDTQFTQLLNDGGQLLAELQARRQAISALLTGTVQLGKELTGLVNDNQNTLGPALSELNSVTDILQANQGNLDKALQLAGPYYRLVGNTLGNGHWMDTYLCDLVPSNWVPPGTDASSHCLAPPVGVTAQTGGK